MGFKIAQISDIHCGEERFSAKNLKFFIRRINKEKPNAVIVVGDLTANGFQDEYEEARKWVNEIKCIEKIVIAGNHDARNVGMEHFGNLFGPRHSENVFEKEKVRIMAIDSNRPDDNIGEVGRDKYKYIDAFFEGKKDFKILLLHHHLVSIPGTGRERNTVNDAGDLLAKLDEHKVDMVLSGHKHVPYVWDLNGIKLVTSGTAGTLRTRGSIMPSINLIDITEKKILVKIVYSNGSEMDYSFNR